MKSIKRVVIACLFLVTSVSFSLQEEVFEEIWYGALLVTLAQGIELIDHPEWFSNCKVVALISFAFDDGYESIYSKAFPIFQEYKLPASVFVITGKINKRDHLTLEQMKELTQEGWEIASHGVTHTPLTELTPEKIRYELETSKITLEKWGFQVSGFASPFGRYNKEILAQIQSLYNYHRSSSLGINPLPLFKEGLGSRWELYYIEVVNDMQPEEIITQIQKVNQLGGWAILTFHKIDQDSWRWTYPEPLLEKIIRLVRKEFSLCTLEEFRKGKCQPK